LSRWRKNEKRGSKSRFHDEKIFDRQEKRSGHLKQLTDEKDQGGLVTVLEEEPGSKSQSNQGEKKKRRGCAIPRGRKQEKRHFFFVKGRGRPL